MEIQSAKLGVIQIEEQSIFEMSPGLYGFEEYKKYALIRTDESLPFAYLQSMEEPSLCLLLADPFAFYHDYEFDLPTQDVEGLGQPKPDGIAVWVTCSVRESLQDATVNLLAPVIFNRENHIARQVVLHDSKYVTRTPLIAKKKEAE